MSTKLRRLPQGVEVFLTNQCRIGADEFGGLLSSCMRDLLERVTIDATYSFVTDDPDFSAGVDPSFGGMSSPDSLVQLGRLCVEILRSDGHDCVLLVEELLMRRSDPGPGLFGRASACLEENLFALLFASSSAAEISDVLEAQYPYPGISVISRLPTSHQLASGARELSVSQIEQIVNSAVMAIVTAWDGEGHILAPLNPGTNAVLAEIEARNA